MKKLFVKIAMMLFVMLGISNYGFYLMTGQLPFSGFSLPDISAPDLNPLNNQPETAYKWVDEKGITHYSNEKPPELSVASPTEKEIEVIEVDPRANIIQSVETPKDRDSSNTTISPIDGPLYKPENVQKLLNDAKNVEKVLQERQKEQDKIINNM